MNKKLLLVPILISLILFSNLAFAEVIYPISTKEEIQVLAEELNKQDIKICPVYNKDKKFEKILSVSESARFYIDGTWNVDYDLYNVDINNDGDDEYVLTLSSGSGRWFDIEAVYKKEDGQFRDIYDEVKASIKMVLWELDSEEDYSENGDAGIMQGGMIVEKENGKICFSLVETHGQWFDWDEDGGQWFEENCPLVHKFLWDSYGVKHIKSHKRCLKSGDFIKQ